MTGLAPWARRAVLLLVSALFLIDAVSVFFLLVNPEAWVAGRKVEGAEALRVYLPLWGAALVLEAAALRLASRARCFFASVLLLPAAGLHFQSWMLAGGPAGLWEAVAASAAALLGLLCGGAEAPLPEHHGQG